MVVPEGVDRGLRKRERPPRFSRLGVAPLVHRPPHCHRRGHRPGPAQTTNQIDVIPAQLPGLLGADADREAQDNVGIEPRLPSHFEKRKRLLESERPARPPDGALGRIDERGHVPSH
jgi:hypothetical protein